MRRIHKKRVIEVFIISVIFIFITSTIFFFHYLTGKAVSSIMAQGGNVTEINATPALRWSGLYGYFTGNTSNSSSTYFSVNVEGGRTKLTEINLDLEACTGYRFYASPQRIVRSPGSSLLETLNIGNTSDVDTFLNVTETGSSQSAQKIFNQTATFFIDGRNLELPSFYLIGATGQNYTVGLLTNGLSFILVSTYQPGTIGYDGEVYDYEIMLPSPSENNVTYYFFQDGCTRPTPSVGGGGGARKRATSPFIIRPEIEEETELKTKAQFEQPKCIPSYSCTDWAPCKNSNRKRSCSVLQSCGYMPVKLPHEEERCGVQLHPALEKPLDINSPHFTNYLSTIFILLFLLCMIFTFFQLRKRAKCVE